MAQEQEQGAVPLREIYINLEQQSLVLTAGDGTLLRFTYSPQGILYQLVREDVELEVRAAALDQVIQQPASRDEAPQAQPQDAASGPSTAQVQAGSSKEKSPTTVLPGKLQTKPKEGNPDRHGKPTAWAQLLAHVEDREGATLLSTSFHGRTRDIALQLDAGAHITAQGYLHLRPEDPVNPRLSTFSVIHLVHYPGKPTKGQS